MSASLLRDKEPYKLSSSWYRAICHPNWPRDAAQRWVSDPRGAFASGETASRASQALLKPEDPGREALYVKHGRRPSVKALRDWLVGRPTPAARAFRIGRVLERAAVLAARPLAAVERKWPGDTYLILAYIDGWTLEDYLRSRLVTVEDPVERDRIRSLLWEAVASSVARLHAARVRQRDLKSPNILIQETGHDDRPFLAWLVDLEGMQALRTLPDRKRRARDLGRLAASFRSSIFTDAGVLPTDWEQFLRFYLEATKASFPAEADLQWWASTTTDWAVKKEARNRRLGRPLH